MNLYIYYIYMHRPYIRRMCFIHAIYNYMHKPLYVVVQWTVS